MSCQTVSHHIVSCPIVAHAILPSPFIPHHIIPFHLMSYRINTCITPPTIKIFQCPLGQAAKSNAGGWIRRALQRHGEILWMPIRWCLLFVAVVVAHNFGTLLLGIMATFNIAWWAPLNIKACFARNKKLTILTSQMKCGVVFRFQKFQWYINIWKSVEAQLRGISAVAISGVDSWCDQEES